MQVDQSATLERQAFEARMTITNGQPEGDLTNLAVTIHFADADGHAVAATTTSTDTSAKFFYRFAVNSSGPASVAAGQSATIVWLIIPSAGAAGATPQGVQYAVGATLTYRSQGVTQTAEVAPATIFVTPVPDLGVDYFVPAEVYGDDPFTAGTIEPPVPFSLGVRITNAGHGDAKGLRLDSGQPRITDNPQNLAVTFALLDSSVNDAPAQPTLLMNFGNVPAGQAAVGRWTMTSSLTGRLSFTATATHAADLGGAVTSILAVRGSHALVRDVRVDLPGRDAVRDFLAKDGDIYRCYESSGLDTDVQTDINESAPPDGQETTYTVAGIASPGFVFYRRQDPLAGTMGVASVKRTDEKSLDLANAWTSKTWDRNAHQWLYYVNIFDDGNPTGAGYEIHFGDTGAHAPVLSPLASQLVQAGTLLRLPVQAIDPDGTIPVLSTGSLPPGAVFAATGPAQGDLTWTPSVAQAGTYSVRFTASDGDLSDNRTISITVVAGGNLIRAWKDKWWPGIDDPAITGNQADPDHDGLSNLVEYALDLDPTRPDLNGGTEVSVEEAGGLRYLSLTYTKRTDDPALSFEVVGAAEANTPETAWVAQTILLPMDQSAVPPGRERVRIRDSQAIETGTVRRFLKLRVTLLAN